MPTLDWTSPAEVRWHADLAAGQTDVEGEGTQVRSFATMLEAVRFVMDEGTISPTMMVGVYPKQGSALIGLAEIEQAFRAAATLPDAPA
jgi:predicted urease superfamily metal-dependent hydrolase